MSEAKVDFREEIKGFNKNLNSLDENYLEDEDLDEDLDEEDEDEDEKDEDEDEDEKEGKSSEEDY